MLAAALLLILGTGTAAGQRAAIDDEAAVVSAVLSAYRNIMHGGTGVAFPEARRPILLHAATISPTRAQLRVRISSPQNRAASRHYATAEVQYLAERLRKRSVHSVAVANSPAGYALKRTKFGACGPEVDWSTFTDAVAVSRVAFSKSGSALLYLEHAGGARAYHATRRGNSWQIDWDVELWACG